MWISRYSKAIGVGLVVAMMLTTGSMALQADVSGLSLTDRRCNGYCFKNAQIELWTIGSCASNDILARCIAACGTSFQTMCHTAPECVGQADPDLEQPVDELCENTVIPRANCTTDYLRFPGSYRDNELALQQNTYKPKFSDGPGTCKRLVDAFIAFGNDQIGEAGMKLALDVARGLKDVVADLGFGSLFGSVGAVNPNSVLIGIGMIWVSVLTEQAF